MHGGLPGHSGRHRIPYLSVLARVLWGWGNTWNQEFQGLWKIVKVIFELKDLPCSRHFWWFWKVKLGSLWAGGQVQVNVRKASPTRITGQSLIEVGPWWVGVSHGVPHGESCTQGGLFPLAAMWACCRMRGELGSGWPPDFSSLPSTP